MYLQWDYNDLKFPKRVHESIRKKVPKLDKKDNQYRVDTLISDYLKECVIGKENRNNKLSNSRIRHYITIYV